MPVTINGTTGVAGVDGTAGTPSYQGGDSNTGMFFPAADTIAFSEGGTEVARFDSSGNFGLGTSSPGNLLTVQTAATGTTAGSNVIARFQSNASGRDATIQFSDNVANSATISMLSGAVSFAANGVQRMQLDTSGNLQFNSGYGSVATAYGCRAWVNFNGTGTVAIRGSGNVSSITDNGTGDYTVNFTTAMPDTNYGFSGMGRQDGGNAAFMAPGTSATSSFRFQTYNEQSPPQPRDFNPVAIAIFR